MFVLALIVEADNAQAVPMLFNTNETIPAATKITDSTLMPIRAARDE